MIQHVVQVITFFICFTKSTALSEDLGCSNRVDVLRGSELPEALSDLLTDRVTASSFMQCALLCYARRCDVAYFHSNGKMCQFTSDTSTNYELLSCPLLSASRLNTGEGEMQDQVHRYCIVCKQSTATQFGPNSRLYQREQPPHVATSPVESRIQKVARPASQIPDEALGPPPRPPLSVIGLQPQHVTPTHFRPPPLNPVQLQSTSGEPNSFLRTTTQTTQIPQWMRYVNIRRPQSLQWNGKTAQNQAHLSAPATTSPSSSMRLRNLNRSRPRFLKRRPCTRSNCARKYMRRKSKSKLRRGSGIAKR